MRAFWNLRPRPSPLLSLFYLAGSPGPHTSPHSASYSSPGSGRLSPPHSLNLRKLQSSTSEGGLQPPRSSSLS